MLEANKSLWFEKIFAVYNRNLFKRRFSTMRVAGLENLEKKKNEIPLIIYANHSSWWDGLVAFEISKLAKLDSYIMMEEKQLEKLFLFRRLGAFSVVRENAREAFESVEYAAKLLNENQERTLWIFPQGEILPNDLRPIKFYNGLGHIIKKTKNCSVCALAMRYEFRGEFKPEIFVRIASISLISADSDFNPRVCTDSLAAELEKTMEHLKNDTVQNKLDDYARIF
jgi:1-acyl-sn-glycerol-3-phosphate acyltransferase